MRRFSLLSSLALLASLMMAAPAHALVLQAQDEVFFNTYVTEDVYVAGNNVTIQQDVDGDLFIAGGNVTVNGMVSGDLFVGGGTVILNGPIKDDVRMLGGALSLNSTVDGDMIVIGGTVDLNKDTLVAGDLVVLAGNANAYGTVNRSVRGILGRLTLGGAVNGDVDVRVTEKLVLLNTGHVFGNLKYFAPERVENHGGAIDGEMSFNEILSSTEKVKEGLRQFLNIGQLAGKLWSFLALLVVGLFMLRLVPHGLERASEQIKAEGLKSFGIGFLVFVVGGMASLLAMFTVVGVQFGFILAAFLFVLGELSRVVSAYWLGAALARRGASKKMSSRRLYWVRFGTLALGLLLVKLIGMIPVLGWVAGFAFLMLGAGGLFFIMRSNYRYMSKEKLI